jgi:hypothetical protein
MLISEVKEQNMYTQKGWLDSDDNLKGGGGLFGMKKRF